MGVSYPRKKQKRGGRSTEEGDNGGLCELEDGSNLLKGALGKA